MDSCRRCGPSFQETEDLEMAWLGKGRGTVARLAGVLELLAWSALGLVRSAGSDRPRADRARGAPVVGLFPAAGPRAVPSQRARRARAPGPPRRPLAAQPRSRPKCRASRCGRSARPPRRCRRAPTRCCIACRPPASCSQVLYDRIRCAAGRPTGGVSIRGLPPRSLPEIPEMPERTESDSNAVSGPRRAVSAQR